MHSLNNEDVACIVVCNWSVLWNTCKLLYLLKRERENSKRWVPVINGSCEMKNIEQFINLLIFDSTLYKKTSEKSNLKVKKGRNETILHWSMLKGYFENKKSFSNCFVNGNLNNEAKSILSFGESNVNKRQLHWHFHPFAWN